MVEQPEAGDRLRRAKQLFDDGELTKAFEAYLALARDGDPECQRFVGWLLLTGKGTRKDLHEARLWLTQASQNGVLESYIHLAYCHHELGNDAEALAALNEATALNYAPAFYHLGLFYRDGISGGPDNAMALVQFREGARRGHLRCQRELLRADFAQAKGLFGRIAVFARLLVFVFSAMGRLVRDERERYI